MQTLTEILLLPLLGAASITVFKGLMPRRLPGIWASLLVGGSFGLAVAAVARLAGLAPAQRAVGLGGTLFHWVTGIGPAIAWQLHLDPLSAVWILIITGVGFLIHVYSNGYMHGDPREATYFSYLNFFIFAMLLLVLAGNLLVLLVGWALVGLASYLLIGFWYERPSAVAAAKKAFVVNTVGDVGILLALTLLYLHYGTLSYSGLFHAFARARPDAWFGWVAFLLYLGAMAKSAQFPLQGWLLDAMEGPTPVSALIHAATMVTAGVYLMARLYPLMRLAPGVAALVAGLGAFTALFAAVCAVFQRDIKRVLAYSTLSQLGYMFIAVGIGAYAAGVFHFVTHAFFKALLFLAAGSVIHALGGEQDMGRMGGLAGKLPVTTWSFLAATLAIAGIPPFAGFFSKEAILGQAFNSGHYLLWAVGVLTAGLTALYMFRAFFLTFFGAPRDGELHRHAHEAPWVMTVPVVLLAVLSVGGGYLGGSLDRWLAPVFARYPGAPQAALESGPLGGTVLAVGLAVVGFAVAYAVWWRGGADAQTGGRAGFGAAAYRGFYVDEGWRRVAIAPLKAVGDAVAGVGDAPLVAAVRGVGASMLAWSQELRPLQTGLVRRYALSVMVGVGALMAYYLIRL